MRQSRESGRDRNQPERNDGVGAGRSVANSPLGDLKTLSPAPLTSPA